jgi:hypothetical protein
VLNTNLEVLADVQVGGDGFAHVHPTLARVDDRLFVAWSSRVTGGRMPGPRVMIEEFVLR